MTFRKARVQIVIPDQFLDSMGDPWSLVLNGNRVTLGLLDILIRTLRECPVKTAGDAERSLDILQELRSTTNGVLVMSKDDYTWMMDRLREFAHMLWKAPESAYLRRWLEQNVQPETADAR